MPKRLRKLTDSKPLLHPDTLAREAISLRKRAKLAHDSETRVEFEEMAERRELLAIAVEVIAHENAPPAEEAQCGDTPSGPSDKPPSDKPPEAKG